MGEQNIIHILLACRDKASMAAFKAALEDHQVQSTWVESGSNALAKMMEGDFDLVVTGEDLGDMTGLELIEKVISKKPMVNCAAVNSLSPADFHEVSEGLGVLMQLPERPGQKEAEKLLSQLKTILNLARRPESTINQ